VIEMLKVGDLAPVFELLSDVGEPVRLETFRDGRVILYFYPKADTPGCTKQACAIQDLGPQIRDTGVTVIGISPDPPERLAKFRAKYNLEFILLSDPDHAVAEAYGAWGEKSMYGKAYQGILRSHAAIDEEGKIVTLEHNVKPLATAELWRVWNQGSVS
jgi:thioredoxin-dependent peroxiredoxin